MSAWPNQNWASQAGGQANPGQGGQGPGTFHPFASVQGLGGHNPQQPGGGYGIAQQRSSGPQSASGWTGNSGGWDGLSQVNNMPGQGWDGGMAGSKRQSEGNQFFAGSTAGGPSKRGPSTLTSEQILKSALRLEEALVTNQITPEQALEAVSYYQLLLAENVSMQDKGGAPVPAGPGPQDFNADSFGGKVPSDFSLLLGLLAFFLSPAWLAVSRSLSAFLRSCNLCCHGRVLLPCMHLESMHFPISKRPLRFIPCPSYRFRAFSRILVCIE